MDLLIRYSEMDPDSEEWEIATAARSSECAAAARTSRRWGWAIVVLGVIGCAGAARIVMGLDTDSEVPPIIVWVLPYVALVAGLTMVAVSPRIRRRSERYGYAVVNDTEMDPGSDEWHIATSQRGYECHELSTVFRRWGYGVATVGVIGPLCATLLLGQWGTDEESDIAPMLILALVSVPMFAGAAVAALSAYLEVRAEWYWWRVEREVLRPFRELYGVKTSWALRRRLRKGM